MYKILNTDVETKKKEFEKFAKLIGNQFKHGGDKFALDGQEGKELTDLVCEFNPGKTGVDWILATMIKYCGRFKNFQREKEID